jgi:hypothetical protein
VYQAHTLLRATEQGKEHEKTKTTGFLKVLVDQTHRQHQ